MDLLTTFFISVTTSCSFYAPQAPAVSTDIVRMQAPTMRMSMRVESTKAANIGDILGVCSLPEALKLGAEAVLKPPSYSTGVKIKIPLPLPETSRNKGKTARREAFVPIRVTRKPSVSRGPTSVDVDYWGSHEEAPADQPAIQKHESTFVSLPAVSVPSANSTPPNEDGNESTKTVKREPEKRNPFLQWLSDWAKGGIRQGAVSSGTYEFKCGFCGPVSMTLSSTQTFLGPVEITKPNLINFDREIEVEWKSVPNAAAYFVEARGRVNEQGAQTTVTWTSANQLHPPSGFKSSPITKRQLAQYLVGNVLLPSSVTKVTIPAGVFKGILDADVEIIALGEDTVDAENGVAKQVVVRSTARMTLKPNADASSIPHSDSAVTQPAEPAATPVEEQPENVIVPAE